MSIEISDYLHTVATIISKRRKVCKLSREELAYYASLHTNTISSIERGDRDITIVSLIHIFAALGCTGVHIANDHYMADFTAETAFPVQRQDILTIKDPELVRRIGLAVKEKRKKEGMKQEDLATSAGLHLNTVWNCEQGLVAPSGYTMYRMYKSLKVQTIIEKGGYLYLL